MKKLILLFCTLYIYNSHAQDIEYTRAILDTLCSPAFDGRGFYNDGEKRTADFIAKEYEKFGLKKFNNSYLQKFSLNTNSITGELKLSIDGDELVPGQDYIVNPASASFKGKSKLYFLDKKALTNIEVFKSHLGSFKDKFIVIDQNLIANESKEVKALVNDIIMFLTYSPEINNQGVIELITGNLTYTAAQNVALKPHLILSKDIINIKNKSLDLTIENVFKENHKSQNVIGYIDGSVKDSFICIVGHYDHLGRMGDNVYFPGANDNASGTAMMLSLAKDFSKNEELKYSVVFIAFGAEEIGLVGSKFYTDHPLFPLDQIKFLLNLDILGTGDDGIQVVNGSEFQNDFDNLVKINADNDLLKEVKIRGKACNSDHCFFTEKGVPSFFIYTLGGIAHYHNIYDKAETLPLNEYEDLFILIEKFIRSK